jgi:hypothetical protein
MEVGGPRTSVASPTASSYSRGRNTKLSLLWVADAKIMESVYMVLNPVVQSPRGPRTYRPA